MPNIAIPAKLLVAVHDRVDTLAAEFAAEFHPVVEAGLRSLLKEPNVVGGLEAFPYPPLITACLDMGLADHEVIARICFAGACGNAYYGLLDRVIDNKEAPDPEHVTDLSLADLLLIRYWSDIRDYFPGESFWRSVVPLFTKAAEGIYVEERCHVGKLTSYPPEELSYVANKSIPLASVFQACAAVAGRDDLLDTIHDMVFNCCIGLQLRDDWRDWEEDLDRARYTYPLQRAMEEEGLDPVVAKTPSGRRALARSLLLGTVYHEVTRMSIDYLESACACAGEALPTTGAELQRYRDKIAESYGITIRNQSELYSKYKEDAKGA